MEYVTYRKFFEEDEVKGLTDLLNEKGIAYEVSEDRESLDSLYGDKQFTRQFNVKIQKSDFQKLDAVLHDIASQELDAVDRDHYLFSFNDDELFDIVAKPDEWNEFDYQLAQRILKERGKEIDPGTVSKLKEDRIRELAKPEEKQRGWIYAGYISSLLGGLFGVFIGWHISSFKKTLPNGERVYGFTPQDRVHGWRILLIGIFMFILWASIRIATTEF